MGSLFGTDGIRGAANTDLGPELALRVGRALARACIDGVLGGAPNARPRVVIGMDTRPSGDMLEGALVAGLASEGSDALLCGVLPTPGVAFHVGASDADAGVVISASHNPPADNGLKIFGPGGWKLDERAEGELERLLDADRAVPSGTDVGRAVPVPDALDAYVAHVLEAVHGSLGGLRVVADCAYGAAWRAAPDALRRAGADVIALHDEPDGRRINDGCGATHPQVVADVARREGVIGLTFDGDADRVLLADEDGRVVDGDAILAILASQMRDEESLAHDRMVVTVMSNQALRTWCEEQAIGLVETPVGDRHVLGAMREQGLVLGGEQAGHILTLDRTTTGDGLLVGLRVLDAVAGSGKRLADLVPFRPLPQVLVNVRVGQRNGLADDSAAVRAAVEAAHAELGPHGRVLVRPSGTEPVVRVMVEARSEDDARRFAERVADAVRGSGA